MATPREIEYSQNNTKTLGEVITQLDLIPKDDIAINENKSLEEQEIAESIPFKFTPFPNYILINNEIRNQLPLHAVDVILYLIDNQQNKFKKDKSLSNRLINNELNISLEQTNICLNKLKELSILCHFSIGKKNYYFVHHEDIFNIIQKVKNQCSVNPNIKIGQTRTEEKLMFGKPEQKRSVDPNKKRGQTRTLFSLNSLKELNLASLLDLLDLLEYYYINNINSEQFEKIDTTKPNHWEKIISSYRKYYLLLPKVIDHCKKLIKIRTKAQEELEIKVKDEIYEQEKQLAFSFFETLDDSKKQEIVNASLKACYGDNWEKDMKESLYVDKISKYKFAKDSENYCKVKIIKDYINQSNDNK